MSTVVPECGTLAGYWRHLRLHQETCQSCRAANAERYRNYWRDRGRPKSTPMQRSENARNASRASWAKTKDKAARTAPARAALRAKFANDADRKAHYQELARRSALVRGSKSKKPKRTFDRAGGDNPQRGLGASGFVRRGGDLAKEEDRKRKKQQEEKQ